MLGLTSQRIGDHAPVVVSISTVPMSHMSRPTAENSNMLISIVYRQRVLRFFDPQQKLLKSTLIFSACTLFIQWQANSGQSLISKSNIGQEFPCGSVVRNPPVNAGDVSLIPGLGRSPGDGHCNPLQHSCLGNPMDREVCQVTVYGVTRVRHDSVTKQQHKLKGYKSLTKNYSNYPMIHYSLIRYVKNQGSRQRTLMFYIPNILVWF